MRFTYLVTIARTFIAPSILFLSLMLSGCQFSQKPAPVRTLDGAAHTSEEKIYEPTQSEIKAESLDGTKEPTKTSEVQSLPQQSGNQVAMLLPLSGKHQVLGKSLQQAAELAIFELGNSDLKVSFFDTKSTPTGARDAAQKAIGNGSSLILGPIFADEVQAASTIARRERINLVAFSNNKSVAGNGVFIMGFSPEEQIHTILKYAENQDIQHLAVLSPHSDYGALLEQQLGRLSPGGMKISEVIHYTAIGNLHKDLSPLKTLKFDALFIPEGGEQLKRVMDTLQTIGVDLNGKRILGTGQWDDMNTLKHPLLSGAWIAAPDPKGREDFDRKYRQNSGQTPHRLASLGYDGIMMAALLKQHMPDNPFSNKSLSQDQGFDGIDGVFRFKSDGTAERKIAILEVKDGHFNVTQNAEKSF